MRNVKLIKLPRLIFNHVDNIRSPGDRLARSSRIAKDGRLQLAARTGPSPMPRMPLTPSR